MTAVLIDNETQEGKAMIEFLRDKDFVTIIDETQADWWDEIPQAARESILRGLEDAEAGRVC
ncbi:MAG: hypothetical protein LBQ73_01000, partial [Tannerellaceae bacterium]|nr:hypothetical protein [Tannerellaceae bacterium]